MANADDLAVEVAYALPHEQVVIALHLPSGTTIGEAITLSRIRERFPEIDWSRNKVGVFGKPRDLDSTLEEGDRVEIYRPLRIDPKEARRLRQGRLD
jgi:putative ubiquitin-RnfH superfamily antitoxin RatB of RatAB toxin-antitoxin module